MKYGFNNLKNYLKVIPAAFAVLFFASCEVGLGNAVDTQAPEVSIVSHNDNDSVASSFVVFGDASDNEGVTQLDVSFTDAKISYSIVPGSGSNWVKKTQPEDDKPEIEETLPEDLNNYCKMVNGVWKWSILVDTSEKYEKKEGNNFIFTASVKDKAGNSGKRSQDECTLIVDTEDPSVSIYKPELYTGEYNTVADTVKDFTLNNSNVISRLLNGDITISGRQSDALSFKELRIIFDSGKLSTGTETRKTTTGDSINSIADIDQLTSSKFAEDEPTVYFSKTLTSSDLREWSLTVKPEDWITEDSPLKSGKHIIRVVTTSLSSSNAWERKVIGYFVWYPEADIPWITATSGDSVEKIDGATECYPDSDFSGNAYDDDALKSITTNLYKRVKGEDNNYSYEIYTSESHEIPSGSPKNAAWSTKVPKESGLYKIDVVVEDHTSGSPVVLTRYFKTSDVKAPVIKIISPVDNSSAILNKEGDIDFNVIATDNNKVADFAFVWLNPAKRTEPSNKIHFLTGEASEWNKATTAGFIDDNGNKIFKLESDKAECLLNKTMNLFSDFGIDGEEKTLVTQEFIFRAVDESGSKTIKALTLTGDTFTPTVEFGTIEFKGVKGIDAQSFAGETLPAFPNSCNLKEATITGTWSDLFAEGISNTTKLKQIEVQWGDNKKTAAVDAKGTWTVNIASPNAGGTITARLSDYAKNTKTVQTAASIETADLSLNRIDCQNDDGAYTTGKVITISLEFTKNTDLIGGIPTLKLNNGGVATYSGGSGTTSHTYTYTVNATDSDVDKLSVSAINANGATWRDSKATESILSVTEAPAGKNLGDTRSITIDKTSPRVSSVTSLTSEGNYSTGSTILLMLGFDEDVTITNPDSLSVKFAHNGASAISPSVTGSRYVLFTYNVAEGHNANPLAFNSIANAGVTVKDSAGNVLSDWTPLAAPSFAGIVIDTNKPNPPVFANGWNPSSVLFEETSFELTPSEAEYDSLEYTTDGVNWTPYTGKVTIANNGNYIVKARQTDKAGNVSDNSGVKSFAIDKGELFTRITAETANGTYSTSTATNSVKGKIVFRKEVEIVKGAKVVLNVKNGANFVTCPLKECVDNPGSSKEFTFEYKITEGDSIVSSDDDKVLDVTGLVTGTGAAISKVKFVEHNVDVDFDLPESGENKLFKENRKIYIVTGKPVIESVTVENKTLKIKFDRNVNKGSGNLVLTYSDTGADGNKQKFYVPAVLSADEYNELKGDAAVASSYKAGTNGAVKDGNYLVNDTSTKYILDPAADDDTDLVTAFTNAKKHMVTVPLIADAASITGTGRAATGDTLSIDLSSTYALPVKGAVYTVSIPAGAVSDDVKNVNSANNSYTITAEGVEAPEIRIVKPVYKVTIPATSTTNLARTQNATVNITDMESATMYLSCRTPGATIKYKTNTAESTRKIINSNPIIKCESPQNAGTSGREEIAALRYNDGEFTTLTAGATVPQESEVTNAYSAAVTLKGTKNVSSYANANGLKIAIAAQASVGTEKSDLSYEYATRTVVKFMISNYRDPNGGEVVEGTGGNTVYMRNLRMWLTGGDGTSGSNSNENTPISWTDTSKFMLMAGSKTNPNSTTAYSDMYGSWWWVTWDITDATYIGFVAGNVPSDGATMGPDNWYCADYHWTTIKEQYPLYPGETLVMMAHGTQNEYVNAKFYWDNTEKLWYYSPYYAKFAFETKKHYTR